MQTPMNNALFRLMSLEFRIKAMFSSPSAILEAAGTAPGMFVVDFGCGPGRYTIPAARLAGPLGRVYAVDLHPLALKAVERRALRHRLDNIETVGSDGAIPLPDSSVDFVLLYDTLHDVDERAGAVNELLRVLKPGGILSYRDHRLDAGSTFHESISAGLLRALAVQEQTTNFLRLGPASDKPTPSAAGR